MTERDFNTLLGSIRRLATATEDAAYDLATTINPSDTAQLIAWVAELNKMIEQIEAKAQADFPDASPSPAVQSGYRH